MRAISFILVSSACVGLGRRVQSDQGSSSQKLHDSQRVTDGVPRLHDSSSLTALAAFLLESDAAAGWQAAGAGPSLTRHMKPSSIPRRTAGISLEEESNRATRRNKPKKKRRARTRNAATPILPELAPIVVGSGGLTETNEERIAREEKRAQTRKELAKADTKGRDMIKKMQKQGKVGSKKKNEEALEAKKEAGAGVMPEEVSERMLQRVIVSVTGPLLLGFATWGTAFYATTQLGIDLPPNKIAYATFAILLAAFGGITYGVLSTNLEEDGEQTFLGSENVAGNWENFRKGTKTSQEAAKENWERLDREEAEASKMLTKDQFKGDIQRSKKKSQEDGDKMMGLLRDMQKSANELK